MTLPDDENDDSAKDADQKTPASDGNALTTLRTSPVRQAPDLRPGPVTIVVHIHGDLVFKMDGNSISIGELAAQIGQMELNMQKTNKFSGDFRGAVVFNDSAVSNAGQIAATLGKGDDNTRQELKMLIEQIGELLKKAPAEKVDDAQAVASASEDLMSEAKKDKPNLPRIKSLGRSLIDIAATVADFAPSAVSLATKIVSIVGMLFGI